VARPRRTTDENVCAIAEAICGPGLCISSKPDPRLVNMVRLLARQCFDRSRSGAAVDDDHE